MGLFNKKKETKEETTVVSDKHLSSAEATPATHTPTETPRVARSLNGSAPDAVALDNLPATKLALTLGSIASIGGFMFGYESGQISGFVQMSDFLARFGEDGELSAVRQGTIVAILCAGTLVGCLASGYLCDKIGRRYTISSSAFFYIVGVIIEITSSTHWVQFAMGRFVAGLGIGALSTSVPMYQSESVPKNIRAAVVSSYQLLITLGIWTAYMVNYGTHTYTTSAQWRIPNGLSALWAIILGTAVLFMPESPRFAYRIGREDEARKNMALLNGVDPYSPLIDAEINEIELKLAAEREGGDHPWYEIFTGPRMLYRTLLGMALQAGQQLTGANFFFYYGTTIFKSGGISDSYVTSIILGSVNVVATIAGLYVVKTCGRRKALMIGAAEMFFCMLIYAFVGHFKIQGGTDVAAPGAVLICFTCIYIVGFATTWGPLVWAIVGELYPARYRASCMALATASNWLFNFLISFFTTFITNDIDYYYGLVFAGSLFCLFWIVFFFVIETKDRSLEEIDTMYVLHVNPRTSASWDPKSLGAEGLSGVETDRMFLTKGGKDIKKSEMAGRPMLEHDERMFPETAGGGENKTEVINA
ncbi:hexose transporter [Sclerotinia borealis F-4128]|uniref:Hexose transporter n=1 Tax=Sclerotinia borealis (strain F-4128) TaxID=1432307 RepID=W9CDC2_SCLBF|nr:hexose transporter [Sclerotinia borealis F-4128]